METRQYRIGERRPRGLRRNEDRTALVSGKENRQYCAKQRQKAFDNDNISKHFNSLASFGPWLSLRARSHSGIKEVLE